MEVNQELVHMAESKRQNITKTVQENSGGLFRFIRSRVPTAADAEDILQEVWYRFTSVVDTEPIEQASAWLFRVARNSITDRYRKKKEVLIDDFTYEDQEGNSFLKEMLFLSDETPENEMFRNIFWETLFEALDELPDNQKDVFVWNEMEDQTFQEISERTGVNIKTLISRKGYAVKHLRKRLKTLYDELLDS